MIVNFPDPRPDELLYSIWARYADRMNYESDSHVILDLFGKNTKKVNIDFPNDIDTIVRRLPPGNNYTTDYFISAHTIAPLFGAFLSSERYSLLKRKISAPPRPRNPIVLVATSSSFSINKFLDTALNAFKMTVLNLAKRTGIVSTKFPLFGSAQLIKFHSHQPSYQSATHSQNWLCYGGQSMRRSSDTTR